ncbi:acyltransferase family protein [Niveibacterium terrae]|uniref:acyltransferase family protein n=1 Tax=Niveibacterium terrae TaxID=3373598 RepID=UPI003A8FF82E
MSDVPFLLMMAVGVFALALIAAEGVLRWVPAARGAQTALLPGRQLSLDGLRGFLAIAVFCHHAAITWFFLLNGKWVLPPSRWLAHAGSSSVALFFMVTAFLFWGRVLDKGNRLAWTELYLARLARLLPLYVFALLAMLVLCFELSGGRLQLPLLVLAGQLGHWMLFTLIQAPELNAVAASTQMLAGVVWSLRYEWMFYLALPVLALLTGAWRALGAAVFGGGVLALLLWAGNPATFADWSRLLCFVGGIIAAWWVRRPALRALARGPVAAVFALLALGGEIAFFDSPFATVPLLGLSVFFVVVASGNELFGLLRLRAAVWLGEISYSVYLLHGLLLWLVFRHPRMAPIWQQVSLLTYCSTVLGLAMLLVAFASMTCIRIEWPGIRLGRSACLAWRIRRGGSLAAEMPAERSAATTD